MTALGFFDRTSRRVLPTNSLALLKSFSRILFLVLAGALLSQMAAAQGTTTGGFVGTVTEQGGGAAIADAVIIFRNLDTGLQVSTRSGSGGQFSKSSLPGGVYEIEVRAPGFLPAEKKVQALFALRENSVIPVPFELVRDTPTAVAQITPTPTPPPVTVTSNAPTDEETITLSSRRGGAFDIRAVRTLPLGSTTLTRTFDELAFLVPGVYRPPQAIGNSVGPGVGSGVGTSGQFSVNGLRSRANNFTVDGSDNNDEDIGVRRQGFFTLVPQPIESIQEFQIITLLAPAEFGRNLGAQVNALSLSGGNVFHGTIYGIGNADFLNARNFFDNVGGDTTLDLTARRRTDGTVIPVLLFNPATNELDPLQVTNDAGEKDTFSLLQGGFAIGGPISRDRLFFFASGEGQFMDGVRERHFAVPTVEERGLLGFGAEGLRGIGPDNTFFPVFSTNLNGDTVFSLFPFPNDPTGIYGQNTYTKALSIDARGVILSGRVDYNLFRNTERPQVFTARYNYTDDKRDLTDVGGALFSAIRPLVRTDNFSTFLSGALTPTLSNEFRFSWGRTRLKFDELRDDFLQPVTSLDPSEDTRFLLNAPIIANATRPICLSAPPCPLSDLFFLPFVTYAPTPVNTEDFSLGPVGQVIIGGFSPVGVDVFNFPQERKNNTYQFADTLRQRFDAGGQHLFAFGADIRRTLLDSDLPRNSRPLVTFFGGSCFDVTTLCPITAGFAQPLDFAATGAASGFSQSLVAPGRDAAISLSYYQLNFFAQDEWRAARNLSLNFGLRYELNTTPKEADEKIEETFGAGLPSFISGLSRFIDGRTNIYESDRNNFAPRLGFAYAPGSRTVLRGGFGIYYDQILGAVVSQSRNVFPTFTTANFGGGTFSNNTGIFTLFNPRYAVFDTDEQGRTIICNAANVVLGLPFGSCDPSSPSLVQPGTLNTLNADLSPQQLNTILSFLNSIFPSGSLFEATLPTRELDIPFSYQYSLGVEHEVLNNTFLSAAYVGTTGRDLLRFATPNLGPNAVSLIAGFFYDDFNCNEDPENPLFCRPLSRQTTRSGGLPEFATRPVPNAGVINQFETTGRSQYHSLQLELRGRLTRAFEYRTNYVYGKVNDDVSDVFDLAGAFALPQNSITLEGEYAPANFDVRHRFAYYFLYAAPLLRDHSDFVRLLLGGWSIAGTGKFSTGQPFTVNSIYDINRDGNLTDRLDNLQFITVTDDRSQPLLRTCDPALGSCGAALAPFGQDGSIPRNSFRAGNILELDLSFAKRFSFRETQDVQFRVDVFNFINRANFGVPIRFLEFPSFGRAVETVTPGRRIQFALKYNF